MEVIGRRNLRRRNLGRHYIETRRQLKAQPGGQFHVSVHLDSLRDPVVVDQLVIGRGKTMGIVK